MNRHRALASCLGMILSETASHFSGSCRSASGRGQRRFFKPLRVKCFGRSRRCGQTAGGAAHQTFPWANSTPAVCWRHRDTGRHSTARHLMRANPKSAVSDVCRRELFRLPPGPAWERRLSLAIGFDCVGDENAGAQQAKQSCCFEHGVYSRTEGAEIQAEMGSCKR
jgi:hypothetical protein